MRLFNRSKVEVLPEPVMGKVDETIGPNQPGRVEAMASYWPAKLYQPDCQIFLLPGEPVLVLAMHNITLLVSQAVNFMEENIMKSLPISKKTANDSGEIVQVAPSETLHDHVHASTEYMMVLQGELELAMQNPKIGWWYRKICVPGECYEIGPGWVHNVTNLSRDRDAMIQRFYE